MCSSSPSQQRPLTGILVRAERHVDWTRRRSTVASSAAASSASDRDIDGADLGGKSVSFSPKVKLRTTHSLHDMPMDDIDSVWRTLAEQSQSTSHIADAVRFFRAMKRYPDQEEIAISTLQDKYCERGIEVFIDPKYKQKVTNQRRLIVASVLSKQEELRQRELDPSKNTCIVSSYENELANLATTISRESVKSARVRAKQDMFAARDLRKQERPTKGQEVPSRPSYSGSSTNAPRFGGLASAALSQSWNRHHAVSLLKRDSHRRFRERQHFVDRTRQLTSSFVSSSDGNDGGSVSSSASESVARRSRCRAAKMA